MASAFWGDVRASLRGEERDYTQGPLGRAIVLLAVPMVLEMAMESLFALVDIFWVAKLGASAAAGVGLTEAFESLIYGVLIGLSAATTAMVARRIGEKDSAGAVRAAVQSLLLGGLFSLPVALLGAWFAPELLGLMGAEASVRGAATGYMRVIQASMPVITLLFLINAIFRGAGDAAIAMRVLVVGNGINIVLDPFFIYGWGPIPEMGVTGAAVTTVIGRTVAVVMQIYALTHRQSRIRLTWPDMRFDPEIFWRLAKVSATGTIQYLIPTASWTALVRLIALFGSDAVAGYTIAIRIVVFSILPSWGLSNAAATLVGQNLGAGQPDRAEASVWRSGIYNMGFLGAIGLVFLLSPRFLVSFFTTEPTVVQPAVDCLRILATGYLFYAYGMVMTQAFNGAGDTSTPAWINLGCYWCLQIPLAWLLARQFGWGESGVFWAIPAAESVLAVVAVLLFRRGRWKLQQI